MADQSTLKDGGIENRSVLCLDPDPAIRDALVRLLGENGYVAYPASSLGEALEIQILHHPAVVITEILLEGHEPLGILRALRKQESSPVLVIYTSQEERRKGKDRRLGQVFEFLVKPVSSPEFIAHIRRAFAFYQEKLSSLDFVGDTESKMRSQLEWLIWKEQSKFADKIHYGRSLIDNIKNSIAQGMGVGGLVTLLELVQLAAKKEGGHYQVPEQTMDPLLKTGEFVRGWLNNLETISQAFSHQYVQEILSGEEVEACVRNGAKAVEHFQEIKEQELYISDLNFPFPVVTNRSVLEMLVRELLTNAYKYSPEGSGVHITRLRTGNSLSLIFMNDILPMEGGVTGIPAEYENEIFEPFYKLNNFYDERFHDEELGMGIGLTVIHNAVYLVGGKIHIFEVMDHATSKSATRRIVAEVIFPIHQDTDEISVSP